MEADVLLDLIAKGEGELLDFKECITSRQKIAKSLVAFANTKGGKLLIGVKDNGKIKGVDLTEEQEMLNWAADAYTKPIIPIKYHYASIEGKPVLVAEIPNSEHKPHYWLDENGKYWAYIRSHDQTLKASKVMLDVMKSDVKGLNAKIHYGKAEKRLLEMLDDHPKVTLKEFCKGANISRRRANGILVNLIRMNIIKILTHEKQDYYTR